MIIDIHTHNTAGGTGLLAESALRNGISKVVLLGDVLRFGYYPTEKQIREINNDTIEDIKKYPQLCYGFCFINPANDAAFILEEMHRCIHEHAFKGVKLEVSVNCRDERLYPVMEKLQEFNLPLLHHCWYKTVDKCQYESDPSDIAFLARLFPSVTIVMAHLAGCGYRGIEDIAECPNVYVDTSGGQPVAGIVEYAVRKLGPARILFGSDAPYRDFSCQLGRIYGADLEDQSKEKILYRNAKEILKS